MKRAIILLSGGLDSTVAAYQTMQESQIILALTFDYGQKAGPAEIKTAAMTCQRLKLSHKVIRLPWLAEICQTALVNPAREVPTPSLDTLDDREVTTRTAALVWVPNRNGLFLNIAAAYAEGLGLDQIVTGFNAEEGATFPDNTEHFITAADHFFGDSTLSHPKVVSPTIKLRKSDIVKKARGLGIVWDQIWPCYLNQERWCGRCESCARSQRAFQEAGEPWPC